MDYKIFTVMLFTLVVFTSCKKDTQIDPSSNTASPTTPTATTPTVTPFVEYRDVFVGTYVGTLLETPYKNGNPFGSSQNTPNYSLVITKSTTKDSVLHSSLSGDFIVFPNGTTARADVTWRPHNLTFGTNSASFSGYYGMSSGGTYYSFSGTK